jgi:glycosyltransferase involved in cell wall biosynthesis
MGETRTVNKGFSMANGEIIGVVNSDDPLLPGAISTIVARMLAEPELLVVYPDYAEIDANGKTIRHIQKFDYSYINMLRWHLCIPGPGTFFRREVVDKLQGRDPQFRYVADHDFWLRAGLIGPFARIPCTLATFRVHPDSASVSQRGDLMAKEHIQLVNKIYSLPDLPPKVLRVKREAYSSAYYVAVSGNKSSITKKKYYLLALYHCPWKYLGEYRRRFLTILAELLYYHPLKALLMRFFQPQELVSIVKRKLFKYQK